MFKKRLQVIMSLFVTFVLLITGFSLSANAEDKPVCKVGDKSYNSLQEAVNAIDGEGTITVISDTELKSDGPKTEHVIKIEKGKNIKITDDGKKHVISSDHPMFYVDGILTLEGTKDENLVFKGGDFKEADGLSGTGFIVSVKNGGTLNYNSATIDGGSTFGPVTGAIVCMGYYEKGTENGKEKITKLVDSHLNINGGVIKNISSNNEYIVSAPVIVDDNASINMTGGEICKNTFPTIGGIYAVNYLDAYNGGETINIKFNLSGGSIHDNKGHALYASCGCDLKMTGGDIYNNDCEAPGTIRLGNTSNMEMYGGKIRNNHAKSGGAIYISNSHDIDRPMLHIYGGEITGNTADYYGGGIFSENRRISIYMENAVIKNNHATVTGGGLWTCPLGAAEININKGAAIYDNKADKAGDDFVNMYMPDAKPRPKSVALSNTALGGGRVLYFNDGKIDPGAESPDRGKNATYWYGVVDESAPRYKEGDPAINISDFNFEQNVAFKTNIEESAKLAAEKNGTLLIANNTAQYGGGVACNADLTFGEEEKVPWMFTVTKQWKDVSKDKQTPIEVSLLASGEEIRSCVLNEENDWTYTFEDLPNPDTIVGGYEVVEKEKGFKVTYSEIVKDEDNHIIFQNITNEIKPPTEENPPTEKDPPKEEVPPTEKKNPPVEEKTLKGPETDDYYNDILNNSVILVVSAAIAFTVVSKRKKNPEFR